MRLVLAALLAVLPASAFAQAASDSVSGRDNIDALIAEHARAYKVPAAFVHRVVKRESNYNSRAKGGSALGLMQIKHATARGLGYSGDASGLYDPNTNLKYGIAYLAGAYRAAQGDLEQAYRYYNRGYYYVAKRLGIEADVPQEAASTTTVAASSAKSANGFDGLFALRGSTPATGTQALAYAAPTTAPADAVEVPLPPRRPAALSGAAEPVQTPVQVAAVQAAAAPVAYTAAAAAAPVQTSDAVEVPLPPRRPSETVLASVARPVTVARKAPAAPVMEATALAATP
ncbi:lytic transglycosylase [Methylobacterium sp. Leaf456]|uniref:transglycosylase SLT domain-containing protein n=1 Tax=Methylobacterium sp. Leaf456 TaxID=1736382 RepID=UPI0006F28BC4|nr:transglycosylase SLT domain-containing protein [Methylobacterium sp. Leaf456]KQT50371.1 lytic transglycosylase [Methylobacterium sp. Leaf456]